MKKFIAIPLLILYLVAVSGAMVQIHFCGSKISSWNLNKDKASCCCATSDKETRSEPKSLKVGSKADDCCSDKTITLKINQEQNRSTDVQWQMQSLPVVLPLQASVSAFNCLPENPVTRVYQANAPPGRWQDIPLYKLHSRFTYYG